MPMDNGAYTYHTAQMMQSLMSIDYGAGICYPAEMVCFIPIDHGAVIYYQTSIMCLRFHSIKVHRTGTHGIIL